MKKILSFVGLCLISIFMVTGCGEKITHVEGNLEDLMTKVYGDIKAENLPMGLTNQVMTKENQQMFIGESNIEYKEALVSESMIGSFAHSVILIRMNEDATLEDIENAKKELASKVNPQKWICVGVEKVHVENNGDLILVVLSDEHADTLIKNFKNLK